jgi:hypothetical protein
MRADAPNSADIVLTSLGSDEAVEEVIGELFKGQEVSSASGFGEECLDVGRCDRCHRVFAASPLKLLRCIAVFARYSFSRSACPPPPPQLRRPSSPDLALRRRKIVSILPSRTDHTPPTHFSHLVVPLFLSPPCTHLC